MAVDLRNPAQYYYSLLSIEHRQVYNEILNGIRRFDHEIQLPLTPVPAAATVWEYVMLDNPLIFYTRRYQNSYSLLVKRLCSGFYKHTKCT